MQQRPVTPYLRDFAVLASFGMNLIVSVDVDVVRRLTNEAMGFASHDPPKAFVSRFFDPEVVPYSTDRDAFAQYVEDLLGLERHQFLSVIRAMRLYVAAMHSIPDDPSLSYTLLVSAVETIVQDFDGFQSTWNDVEERKRHAIDAALEGSSEQLADAVRGAIVEVEHIAMNRRYRDFVLSKVDGSYFRLDDAIGCRPISRHQLPQALRQAYQLRSRYIHSAKTLPDALTHPHGHWEVTEIDRKPNLTIQGLARITRHVIQRFVFDGPKVENETYDYSLERAGIVMMPLASQYWISRPLKDVRDIRKRLEGFLGQIEQFERGDEKATLTDLRDMLGDVEKLLPQAPTETKSALYVLYVAYHLKTSESSHINGWQKFQDKYADIGDHPTSDVLIGRTLLGTTASWPIATHQEAYCVYWKERATKSGLHAPRLFEAAAALSLAERYRENNQMKKCMSLIAEAIECYPGQKGLEELEQAFDPAKPIVWREALLEKT